jgi:hypothetical protein
MSLFLNRFRLVVLEELDLPQSLVGFLERLNMAHPDFSLSRRAPGNLL